MTDRDTRLLRAATRLADAVHLLERAADDLWPTRPDLAAVADRRRRSLLWMRGEIRRDMRKREAKP